MIENKYHIIMNYFTQLSIQLANQKNYLDQLFKVYPLAPESIREIDKNLWDKIEYSFNKGNNKDLFESLLELDLFPIKDSYVPYFRKDKTAIDRNPQTVNRICGRIKELGLEQLWEKCTQPKETNRQMGPLFRRWLQSGALGIQPIDETAFIKCDENAILDGSDQQLMHFAKNHLGYTRNKGLDFIGKFNGKFVIGEAKFLSDDGGHQNDQFLDCITTLESKTNLNVVKVGILDGILYIPGNKKMYKAITEHNKNIMSALLLRTFLYSI